MFAAAELGNTIDKTTYRHEALEVRQALLQAQHQMATSDIGLIIVVAGCEGAGKGETVNLLLEWMDTRGIATHAMQEPSAEERQFPPLWRFWRRLPPTGHTAIFFGAWYQQLILQRVDKKIDDTAFLLALDRIEAFERMLTAERLLLVKFWLHLSKAAQKARFQELESDPQTRWRVNKEDWRLHKRYKDVRFYAEQALRRTSIAEAPWHIIDSADQRYRHLAVGRTLVHALQQRLTYPDQPHRSPARTLALPAPAPKNLLNQLNLNVALPEPDYDQRLARAQGRLYRLTSRLAKTQRSLLVVFEGPDAAGKGGTIRRITPAMDARLYQVITIAAPTDEERAHPYLWRFWRHLPRPGHITIYDRSWYGRVLVERLEGLASTPDWQRAYEEIGAFEQQLTDFGILLLKLYLVISPDEQLRRFQERQVTPYKQYKLTEEDWRNREKWHAYEAAACDMITRTSTATAPWILVPGNDKNYARVTVLETICHHLRAALKD